MLTSLIMSAVVSLTQPANTELTNTQELTQPTTEAKAFESFSVEQAGLQRKGSRIGLQRKGSRIGLQRRGKRI